MKAERHLRHVLSTELFGRRYRQRGEMAVQGVCAIERQRNYNPHVHALWGHPQVDLGARELGPLRAWLKQYANDQWGFARMDVVRTDAAARSYVIDYAAKHGELYFSDHLEDLLHEQRRLM